MQVTSMFGHQHIEACLYAKSLVAAKTVYTSTALTSSPFALCCVRIAGPGSCTIFYIALTALPVFVHCNSADTAYGYISTSRSALKAFSCISC